MKQTITHKVFQEEPYTTSTRVLNKRESYSRNEGHLNIPLNPKEERIPKESEIEAKEAVWVDLNMIDKEQDFQQQENEEEIIHTELTEQRIINRKYSNGNVTEIKQKRVNGGEWENIEVEENKTEFRTIITTDSQGINTRITEKRVNGVEWVVVSLEEDKPKLFEFRTILTTDVNGKTKEEHEMREEGQNWVSVNENTLNLATFLKFKDYKKNKENFNLHQQKLGSHQNI